MMPTYAAGCRVLRSFLWTKVSGCFPIPAYASLDPAGFLPIRATLPEGLLPYWYQDSSFVTCSSEYCRRSAKKFRMSCTWDIRTFAPSGPPGQLGQKRS